MNRFNFDQLLISTIDTLKASAIEKCVHADKTLLSIYAELEDLSDKNNNFKHHTTHLEGAISQNKEWVSTFGFKSSNSYWSKVVVSKPVSKSWSSFCKETILETKPL